MKEMQQLLGCAQRGRHQPQICQGALSPNGQSERGVDAETKLLVLTPHKDGKTTLNNLLLSPFPMTYAGQGLIRTEDVATAAVAAISSSEIPKLAVESNLVADLQVVRCCAVVAADPVVSPAAIAVSDTAASRAWV